MFFFGKVGIVKVTWRHGLISELNIWLQLHTLHLKICRYCIHINWKWCHKHKLTMFLAISKRILRFLYQKHGCIFFTSVQPGTKMLTVTWHRMSQHCMALLFPCPRFSSHSVNNTLVVWWLLSNGCVPRLLLREMLLLWHGTGPCAAHRPHIVRAYCNSLISVVFNPRF